MHLHSYMKPDNLRFMEDRYVIAVVNRKGGVSKTTTCGYISECLLQANRKVTGVDTDPEKGWVKWRRAANFDYPVLEATAETVATVIKELSGFIVIDTPPNDGEIIFSAGLLADEIIIPVAATGHDVSRLQSTLAIVERVEQAKQKPLASVLLTRWKHGTRISKEVVEHLSTRDIPVAQTRIKNLTRYEAFGQPSYLEEYEAFLKEIGVF